MSKPEIPPEGMTSVILRYDLAVVSVCIALGAALLRAQYGFNDVADPLFLFSLALTSWYAGLGPAILAVFLASLPNDYFFIEPLYSLTITPADIPHFVIFLVFALLISGFAAARRRFEQELLRSREELAREVAERTQQASLLNLTHDSIFVRDMDFIIRYWNHGAQELYGWPAEEAIGKMSHQLLQTVYPIPLARVSGRVRSSP